MESENYRQLLNTEYKVQGLTSFEFDDTLMHFAMLYHEEQININEKNNFINYSLLVDEYVYYPVTYIIHKDKLIRKDTTLKGGDLTENQIKELYYTDYFKQKPTEYEKNKFWCEYGML